MGVCTGVCPSTGNEEPTRGYRVRVGGRVETGADTVPGSPCARHTVPSPDYRVYHPVVSGYE